MQNAEQVNIVVDSGQQVNAKGKKRKRDKSKYFHAKEERIRMKSVVEAVPVEGVTDDSWRLNMISNVLFALLYFSTMPLCWQI